MYSVEQILITVIDIYISVFGNIQYRHLLLKFESLKILRLK